MKKTTFDEEELREDDIYSEESRDDLVENDELKPNEAGFMQGYEDALL